MKKERLYEVSLTDKRSGNKLKLRVWAENCDAATGQLAGVLFGHDREYTWRGTGPVHKNNQTVEREVFDYA